MGPQDATDLFEIYGNPLTMEFASDPCFTSPTMVAQMMASVVLLEQAGASLECMTVEREGNKVIGTCGLHSFNEAGHYCEVGCLLNAGLLVQRVYVGSAGIAVRPREHAGSHQPHHRYRCR
ncbi:GNAT family N-acetyltransferase [Aeromonas dhakensis]|nr:GNAT family N-acetyltransferase [Aeromonas dhakensis]USP12259.1 GNAT family N-acetyltransferase [Aeromonas dhakensis]